MINIHIVKDEQQTKAKYIQKLNDIITIKYTKV